MVRALVADDHDSFRLDLLEYLRLFPGLTIVGEARNGLEAVQRTQLLCPDLVLLDVSMPVMSGLEAARRIKRDFPRIVIVFISIHDEDIYRIYARRAGIDGFISKNMLKQELFPLLERLLNPFHFTPQTR